MYLVSIQPVNPNSLPYVILWLSMGVITAVAGVLWWYDRERYHRP